MNRQNRICAVILIISMLLSILTLYPIADTEPTEPSEEEQEQKQTDYTELSEELLETLRAESKIFSYVDEKSFAEAGHIERLYELEEENTYAFKNADGTRSVYYLAEAVKYEDETGTMVEKDLTLTTCEDGYCTKKNNTGLVFPTELSSGVLFSSLDGALILTPQTENMNCIAIIDEENNTATYSSAFGEGISLRYTPTLAGFKEEIILEDRTNRTGIHLH